MKRFQFYYCNKMLHYRQQEKKSNGAMKIAFRIPDMKEVLVNLGSLFDILEIVGVTCSAIFCLLILVEHIGLNVFS